MMIKNLKDNFGYCMTHKRWDYAGDFWSGCSANCWFESCPPPALLTDAEWEDIFAQEEM